MREGWIGSDRGRLFFVEEGEGVALVFLHGGLTDHRAVLPLVAPLAAGYRVVTPDLRGSGKSWSSDPLTFGTLSHDLLCLLDALEVDAALLGGISSGTGPVVRFALDHPERTLGLVLVHPVYGGGDVGYTAEQAAAFSGMDAVARRAGAEGIEVLREMYYSELPEPMAERAWAIASSFDPPSVVATSHFIASGVQPFQSASELDAVRAPVLLFPGNDPIHPSAVSDLYAAKIPDCTVVAEFGAEATESVRSFMDGITASQDQL